MRILEADTQTEANRLGKLGEIPRRVPGKGHRGRQKAEQGRQWKRAGKKKKKGEGPLRSGWSRWRGFVLLS